jgi:hypothetical protein
MKPYVLVPVLSLLLLSRLASAEEPTPVANPNVAEPKRERRAETWKMPECAPSDADGEFRMSTGCSGVFGVRGGVTDVDGAPAGGGPGLMVSAEGEEFLRRKLFSAHGSHWLALGGGGAGFEGTLGGSAAGGFRVPIGERHGPVLRAGVVGYLRGNDAFYSSLLELPQVQVGYQYMRGTTVFELAATSGVVLTGRERVGDTDWRKLGGFEVGAHASVQIPWLRLSTRAVRLPTQDRLGAEVGMLEATLCGRTAPFAVCADGRAMRTDAFVDVSGAIASVRGVYAGLTFGFTRER